MSMVFTEIIPANWSPTTTMKKPSPGPESSGSR